MRSTRGLRDELVAHLAEQPFGPDAPESALRLWERLRDLAADGKLVRPALVDLGYRTVRPGAGGPPEVVRLGIAFELLHAALLVHDDVIDRDRLRRGRPTVAEQFRRDAVQAGAPEQEAAQLGVSAGVIGGDVLLTQALRLAASCSADPAVNAVVAPVVFDAATQAAAGELEDVLFSLHRYGEDHPDAERILAMERRKTAGYSFEAPLRSGALLAGASAEHAGALAAAGSKLGVAYQVIDDVLGTFGDPRETGKPADTDLREGKATVLTCHARSDAGARDALARVAAAEAHGLDALASAVAEARTALRASGAVEYATGLAAELVAEARHLIGSLGLGPREQEDFAAACHHILHRKA